MILLIYSIFLSHSAFPGTHPTQETNGAGCSQFALEGEAPPQTQFNISPRQPLAPFYQWYNNNGYCGEVSLIQAAMNSGEWLSQYNARLICGSGLSQAGSSGFCEAHKQTSNYNAQMLLESPLPGDKAFSSAELCLRNARLNSALFNSSKQPSGLAGYQQFMSWIKSQMIAGKTVSIGLLHSGDGTDPQYDHIVTIDHIGTNHSLRDKTYHDDDVLWIEDHGSATVEDGKLSPIHGAIPVAAGDQAKGCNPFLFGYTFGSLAKTRKDVNSTMRRRYAIVIPGEKIKTKAGGDGIHENPRAITVHNYGFAVSGPADQNAETRPVTLKIIKTRSQKQTNPPDPLGALNYEAPMIGTDVKGNSCTNDPPSEWMQMDVEVTVHDLTPREKYNLYRYEFDRVTGTGSKAALDIPTSNFNKFAKKAKDVLHFTASGKEFSEEVHFSSDKIVVFRCVLAKS